MTKCCDELDMNKSKEAYREHGWPPRDCKKKECMEALEKAAEDLMR